MGNIFEILVPLSKDTGRDQISQVCFLLKEEIIHSDINYTHSAYATMHIIELIQKYSRCKLYPWCMPT